MVADFHHVAAETAAATGDKVFEPADPKVCCANDDHDDGWSFEKAEKISPGSAALVTPYESLNVTLGFCQPTSSSQVIWLNLARARRQQKDKSDAGFCQPQDWVAAKSALDDGGACQSRISD